MKSKILTLMLSASLAASLITGCGNTADSGNQVAETTASTESAEITGSTNTSESAAEASSQSPFESFISSLHAGQYYAYAPICEGENALLVTSYTFDDLEGHQATYEATVYVEKSGSIEKVTTIQSSGTAYPVAVTDDNSIILCKHNSVSKGYVSKDTGKFIISDESHLHYTADDNESYHNYKNGAEELSTDSALYDELYDKYMQSDILSFEKAGVAADGTPNLAGGVYAAYSGDDLYNVSYYIAFENETSGSTETPDGMTGLPFTYEQNGESITFHLASADDTTEAKFAWDNTSPTLNFTGENALGSEKNTIVCLGGEDPATFDAVKYYDNDNNLYMQVESFDENSFTGDLYREERIKAEYVDNATEGSTIYSINGTQFEVVSFEAVNSEIGYGTDAEFKKDVTGEFRFDGFLVKCGDDNFYYALEKEEYADEYKVVPMLAEGNLRKLVDEKVTFKIKEDCEILLQKFVENEDGGHLDTEYIIGREFKGDNYPGWSADAKEYYLTSGMLVAISAVDGELYNAVQIYVP